MLTRLEANNFKNLINFDAEFGPVTCLAGPNGVGKSNVFDAIQFLSFLADKTIMDAALSLRGSERGTADLLDLFWTDGVSRADRFHLAAEMLIDEDVFDEFGRPAKATSTYLRYEVTIGYERPVAGGSLGRLVLLSEVLDYLTEGDAAKRLRFPHSAQHFRKLAVQNRRRTVGGFISTEKALDGQTEIYIHQDGGSRGKPQKAPAATAPKTIVATSNTSATPTILAARREMQKWRILALEPSAMRSPDRFHDDPHVSAHGDHLAATLYRLASKETGETMSPSVYARVANRLSQFVPVSAVNVARDDARQVVTLEVQERTGARLPARSLSDGTLRFLTLAILLEDADADGLICMEEPENGIHPAKIREMVSLLYDLAVDSGAPPSSDNPLRQVIIATHSPVLVQLMPKDDLLFAVPVSVRGVGNTSTSTLRVRPIVGTWRDASSSSGVGLPTILSYLSSPPGAQLSLAEFDAAAEE